MEWPGSQGGGGGLSEQLAALHDYNLYHDGQLLAADSDQRTLLALDLCSDDTAIEVRNGMEGGYTEKSVTILYVFCAGAYNV